MTQTLTCSPCNSSLRRVILLGGALIGFFTAHADEKLAVAFDETNGGVKSLILSEDPNQMNWVEGKHTWGVPEDFTFKSMSKLSDGLIASYENATVKIDVERRTNQTDGAFVERYRITNTGEEPVTYSRGALSIPIPFNDSYERAPVCVTKRCHAHIWCGGEGSWIHAKKMGPYPTEVALVLTEGSLDSYSVWRCGNSNDRGDFMIHPDPFTLQANETKVIAWEIVSSPAGGFRQALAAAGGVKVDFKHETIFPGENFEIDLTAPGGKVTHRTVKPDKGYGEYKFEFECAGKRVRAVGYYSPDVETLVATRVKFICEHQQVNDPHSPYDGAFVIYDNETKKLHISKDVSDHNAARERVGMGLLLARWCKNHPEDRVAAKALSRWEKFLIREVWDAKTGWVCNTIGHNQAKRRLYNVPWVVDFWLERWEATQDRSYLDKMALTLRAYYENGGVKHYPNAAYFADAVKALADAAHPEAKRCRAWLDEHVKAIISRGLMYPRHEVNFEQSITAPAAHLTASWCECFGKDSEILKGAIEQNAALERFSGDQPHYRLGDVPIRHWDGYWFGKRRLYGDTFPHYWSVLSGNAFWRYARVTGDDEMRRRAARNLRNTLCVVHPDGTASCAYLFPYSVTMTDELGKKKGSTRRGEYEDPWANDQDFGLYIIYRAYSIDPNLFRDK